MEHTDHLENRFHKIEQSVLSAAEADYNARVSQAEQLQQQVLHAFRQQLMDGLFEQIQRETTALRQQTVVAISAEERQAAETFFHTRQALSEALFSVVAAQLVEYSKQPAYHQQVRAELLPLQDHYNNAASQIFLSSSLAPLLPEIGKAFPQAELLLTDNFATGGWTLTNTVARIYLDRTLDYKLQQAKDWFLQTSGLTATD